MPILDSLQIAAQFARTRWRLDFRDRLELEAWQARSLAHFLCRVAPLAARYRDLGGREIGEFPFMDKTTMMSGFAAGNTRGISLDSAQAVALKAEQSRDFNPMLGDLTVGLSSGTSGHRGLFLVSPAERLRWAGTLLARTLPTALLTQVLSPWQAPLRIAFFLRANSRLYTTLASRRIDFRFFDLLYPLDSALPTLAMLQPDVLVAPATVLRALADESINGGLAIQPRHVISVAEVLEPDDAQRIEAAFGCRVHQIYQATEGFLGYTCEEGTLHLNETFVHFEKAWMDESMTRFQPIITDFSRDTQLIVRYRLNDVLRVAEVPCSCGRAELSIASIEGRADDVMRLPRLRDGKIIQVFPDTIRQAMMAANLAFEEYGISAQDDGWQVAIKPLPTFRFDDVANDVAQVLDHLCLKQGVVTPRLMFSVWKPPASGDKRRRIRGMASSEKPSCMS